MRFQESKLIRFQDEVPVEYVQYPQKGALLLQYCPSASKTVKQFIFFPYGQDTVQTSNGS